MNQAIIARGSSTKTENRLPVSVKKIAAAATISP
jgi:hypothetical protein